MQITRQMKREAAEREVKMRRRVYPKWVQDGRMTQAMADQQIAVMAAIAADYAEPDLFDGAPI
jgi:hypothetical protein